MGAFVVVKPTTEPVSLGEARAHLRLDTSDTDASLAGYIIAARQYAENYTRQKFMQQTWDVTWDGGWPMVGGEYRLDLPFGPVASVSQITYLDTSNVTQTLAATEYLLRGSGSDAIPYIVPNYLSTWPAVLDMDQTIRVRFVAGFGSNPGDTPEAIRQAILMHVEILYDRNPQTRTMLQESRDALLDPYRLVRL